MIRGDFVRLKRNPEWVGIVVDVWQGFMGAERGSVMWETGRTSPVDFNRDVEPCAPVPFSPKARAALKARLAGKQATIEAFAAEVVWLASILATKKRKGGKS